MGRAESDLGRDESMCQGPGVGGNMVCLRSWERWPKWLRSKEQGAARQQTRAWRAPKEVWSFYRGQWDTIKEVSARVFCRDGSGC